MQPAYVSTAGIAVLLCLTLPLQAQSTGEPLTIHLSGPGALPVEASTGAGRVALGQAVAGQPMSVLASALNVGKGTRINATIDRTGPEPKLVLVPEGISDETCRAARADDEGACQVVGGFRWGETASLGVTAGAGGFSMNSVGLRPTFWNRLDLGVGYAWQKYTDLESIACGTGTPDGCAVDDLGSGLRISAGYALTPSLSVGVRYARSGFSLDKVNAALSARLENRGTIFEGYAEKLIRDLGPVDPYLEFGWGWWSNRSEIHLDGTFLELREEAGGRVFGGGGFKYDLGNGWGVRAGARYTRGKSGDAETNISGILDITRVLQTRRGS